MPAARAKPGVKPGDVLTFDGFGFGPVTPDNPAGKIVGAPNATQSTFKASFAGVPATVNYSGLVVGFVGPYEFNVVVTKVAAGDAVPFTFTLGENSTPQSLLIAVQ